jgi:hypothetical protein
MDNARLRKKRKEDPEKVRARDRAVYHSRPENWIKRARLRKYKITPVEWDKLFEQQGKVCAICKDPYAGWKRGTWHTDHDHKTGIVRGILCHHCNHMLGAAKDNPDCLIEGAKYLRERNGGPNAGNKA